MTGLTAELHTDLEALDTPTVCNALEVVAPKRRGYGYTTSPLVCLRPELGSVVAVARTATIRAAHPSDLRGEEARRLSDDYYAYIAAGPKPSLVVVQDLDGDGGYGSFWGEVNSAIHKGLGCRGVITDGCVRDVPDIAEGFQVLAASVLPSHAFVHVVDFGRSVDVAGMKVRSGDLIHADQHGAVVIPREVASQIPEAAAAIARRERVIIDAANEPDFDVAALRRAQGRAAETH
ncbi:MAG: RraA family protein [Acidobacteriota bacterium]